MKRRIWLLVLIVSVGLGCGKRTPADREQVPYTLKVTFEGLVGYVNKSDTKTVWAVLPKARQDILPAGYDPKKSDDYPPEHYAYLKINGVNVKGFGIPVELQIPIDGIEIQVSEDFGGSMGIPPDKFRQTPSDPNVDKLDSKVLDSDYPKLAARVKLPFLIKQDDWVLEEAEDDGDVHDFVNVYPEKDGNFCKEPDDTDVTEPRVQAVTWQRKELTGEVTLKFRTLGGTDLTSLVLVQYDNKDTIQVRIHNKDAMSLHQAGYEPIHWPAYRWFYNLSVSQSDCTKHYYPQGETGGNRCPQKLYSE
jgi:hypothetical protein